jgi:hypothetical protein
MENKLENQPSLVKPIEGKVTEAHKKRFFAKVKINTRNGCHTWSAACRGGYDKQYGVFNFNGRIVYAHRFALYMILGHDPGPSVDHLCHNTKCVNPAHLRGGSIADNNANRRCVISEYCINGHERTSTNTYTNSNDGKRHCRECAKQTDKKRYAARYEKEKMLKTNSSSTVNNKLSFELAEEIRAKYNNGTISQRELAREYHVSQPLIGMIVRSEIWITDINEKG